MPGLYDIGSNVANVAVSNTTGLYIGSGAASILNNAEQLLLLLSNQGNVNFALANGNTTVQGFFIGNTSVYSNANVAAYLPINSANVAAGYFFGDGRNLTNLPQQSGTYTNANVAAYLPTFDGNIGQPGQRPYFVYSSFFVGDGSGLTNLPSTSTYGNANVAAYLPNNTSNVAATYFLGDGSQLTNLPIPGVYGNANVAAYLLTNTGNIAAGYFIGDGSQLTNVPSSYGNTQVAAFLPTYTGTLDNSTTIQALFANAASQSLDISTLYNAIAIANNNTAAANITISNLEANVGAFETYANATFTYGNSNVAAYLPTYGGTINVLNLTGVVGQDITLEPDGTNDISLNSDTVKVGDNNVDFTLSTRGTGNLQLRTHLGSAVEGNITLMHGANGNIKLWPNGSGIVEAAGNVKANYFIGDGSQLTGLPVAYGNTQVAAYLPTYTGTLAQSSTIIDLYSNAATQATGISTLNANLGAFQTYANTTFGTSGYSNVNVAAYLYSSTSVITNSNSSPITIRTTANTAKIITGYAPPAGGTDWILLDGGNILLDSAGNVTMNSGYGFQDFINIESPNVKIKGSWLEINSGGVLDSAVRLQGNIIATSNITGAYLTGTGVDVSTINSSGMINAGNIRTTNGLFWANGTNYASSIIGGAYSDANVAAYLPTYTGNIGNLAITTGKRWIYSGNLDIISNNTTSTGGIINLLAYKSGGMTGNINIIGGQVEIGYGLSTGDKITINGPTDFQGKGLSGNIFTFALGNVVIQNNSTQGTNKTTTGGYLWIANTASANRLVTDTGVFWSNGTALLDGTYGNTQVAAYLPTYTGQFGGNLTDSTQPGIRYIGPNPNTGIGALDITGAALTANSNVITISSGFNVSNPGSITVNSNGNGNTTFNTGNFYVYGDALIQLEAQTVSVLDGNLLVGPTVAGVSNYGWLLNTLGGVDTGVVKANTMILQSGTGITYANGTNYLNGISSSINTINANLGAFQTYANATFGSGSYGNVQMRANLAANSTQTSAWSIPFGGNAARPSAPFGGMIRYNTDYNVPEWYSNVAAAWYAFSNPVSPAPPAGLSMWYVAVGGGGSGGSRIGAGGGAGGLLTGNATITSGTTYTITVGAGGAAVTSTPGVVGNDGGNTTITGSGFSTITAIGGGGGGAYIGTSGTAGRNGGSGGGGSYSGNGGVNTAGSGTSGQGSQGGAGSATTVGGGGGGGASNVGEAVQASRGGNGGNGSASTITGANVTYAGGGGGSFSTGTAGTGGTGGGGAGSVGNNNATAGTNFLGGGGGGARNDGDLGSISSGKGGDGVVIIRIANVSFSGSYTGSNVAISYAGGDTILKFSASGTYTG